MHYWFKSYGNFAEWVDFAHWLGFIGKGLRLQPAQQACFLQGYLNDLKKSSFSSNQFLIQSFSLDITFQLLPHPGPISDGNP